MRLIIGTAVLLAVAACGDSPAEAPVTVEQAWVQLPAMKGRPGSAYFVLRSAGRDDRLRRVSSQAAERIELHETRSEGGISRMAPLDSSPFNDTGEIEFRPGRKHAMLFGLDPALKAGDRIPLTFTFDHAPPVTAEAEVRTIGGAHAGH